jgi:hypothetical protein
MKKVLFIFIFLIFLVFPVAKVGATPYFVGVQIKSATTPTGNNWCLPPKTTLEIQSSSAQTLSPEFPTKNPTESFGFLCAEDTIWSGLFNIESGSQYKVVLGTPNGCPGNIYNELCWVIYGQGSNEAIDGNAYGHGCTATCAYYGLTPYHNTDVCPGSTCCNLTFDEPSPCSSSSVYIVDSLLNTIEPGFSLPRYTCIGSIHCDDDISVGTGYDLWYPNKCFLSNIYKPSVACDYAEDSATIPVCSCSYSANPLTFVFDVQL